MQARKIGVKLITLTYGQTIMHTGRESIYSTSSQGISSPLNTPKRTTKGGKG